MATNTLLVREIKKALSGFDLSRAVKSAENEAQTRTYLVEPFFASLRYLLGFEDGCLVPEYDADFANLKGKKVDYAIQFKKKPEIIIEVKKAGTKLTELHLRQLNEYFIHTNEAKIGVLTNGTIYQFYCRKNNAGPSLHPTPFYSINLETLEGDSLEALAKLHISVIEIRTILLEAQELFFLEDFELALFNEFNQPSKDFVKAIFSRMDGKQLTTNIENQIRQLINSVSVKSALDRLMIEESTNVNSGIITTEAELNIFHVIKTILAQHKQVNSESIGYRDQKGKFSILIDNNQKKKICDLYITSNSKKLEINGEKFDIPDIDSIIKLKKKLTDQMLSLF
jgi:hypothetical protein